MPAGDQGPDLDRVKRTMDRVADLRTRSAEAMNDALRAARGGLLAFAVWTARQVDGYVVELEAVCTSTDCWAPELGAGLRAGHLTEARADQRRLWDALDAVLRCAQDGLVAGPGEVTP